MGEGTGKAKEEGKKYNGGRQGGVVYTIDGYRVGELVREIIRRARACRWKPHAALFKLNPVRIIIGEQLGPLPLPGRLIPRDRICEYEKEKKNQRERKKEREKESAGERNREGERKKEETEKRQRVAGRREGKGERR